MSFGSVVKTIGEDALKVVEYPFVNTAKFVKVLDTAIQDQPELKTALTNLVKNAEVVISDGGLDVASKGLDIAGDLKTLEDAKAFFTYFVSTFLPIVESVYAELAADTK